MRMTRSLTPRECAELISGSGSVVALTGAGVSTAVGIPDFRGPRGLYVTRRYDPEKVFDIRWFRKDPGFFYEFARDFAALVSTVRPGFTHRFLAGLESSGILGGVVTQNIDMLHQAAGSRNVVELHGSYGEATCEGCGRAYRELSHGWWVEAMERSPRSPVAVCRSCGGVLKPEIVFFGEMVKGFEGAEGLVAGADLLLILGSSLTVTPASFLPHAAGGTTVVVNRGPVALDPSPNRFFVDRETDPFFREVAGLLGMCVAGESAGSPS